MPRGAASPVLTVDLAELLNHEAVQAAIDTAFENSDRSREHFDTVLSVLATAKGEARSSSEIAAPLSVSQSQWDVST